MSDVAENPRHRFGKSLDDLPTRLQALVRDQLREKEEILWVDQPLPWGYAWRMGGCATFGVVWFAVSVASLVGFIYGDQGLREALPGLVGFFGLSFGAMSAPFWGYQAALRTAYVVTNCRVICFLGWPFNYPEWSLPLNEIDDVMRWTWHDRSGTLHFLERPAEFRDDSYYAFHCVPEVRELMQLVKQLIGTKDSP